MSGSPDAQLLPDKASPAAPALTAYPWSVALLAAAYAAASVALVRSILLSFRTEPLFPDAFATVAASPWALATLADFGVGAAAAAAYIAVREAYDASRAAPEDGLLGADGGRAPWPWAVRAAAWVAATCCLGNPVVCVYAVTKMAACHGVSTGLLPAAGADGGGSGLWQPAGGRRVWPALALGGSVTAFLAFGAVCLWAGLTEGLSAGWAYIRSNPWAWTTFLDNAVGLAVSATYVWVRERGAGGWRRVAWMAALLLGGNGGTAAYVATMAVEGMAGGEAAEVVLSRRQQAA